MNRFYREGIPAFLLMLFLNPSLDAATLGSVEISLHGNIVASSCTFSQDDDNQTIPLGDWPVKNFSNSSGGVRTQPVYFGISLTDCSASATELVFSGKQDSSSAELLALDSDSSAENVAIEILDAEKNRVALNTTVTNTVDSSGNVAYTFYANYISTGVVSAGSANGTLTFTINYS
ncbi:fimbrial protein [Pantoea agglomerans]|nr:fimbrial protein [Pantoea agglomerans]WIL42759.1 fimbrial protein [Pantoea agglomerans]